MKHNLKITIALILLFFFAQFAGLLVIKNYMANEKLPFDIERPQFDPNTSYIPIIIAIIIGTLIALFLARFKAVRLWKFWFFISVFFTLLIAFGSFMNENLAFIVALGFAILKVFRPNFVVQNFSELFIYAGLAAIFVPVLNLWSISILLIVISIYDMWAVWKTKHMVKLAEFQTESNLFAGLHLPYGDKKVAIIGGGDIGFPLMFSGVILKTYGLTSALIATVFITLSLTALLIYSKKNKFYPAMPFLAIGCFVGYLVIRLLA